MSARKLFPLLVSVAIGMAGSAGANPAGTEIVVASVVPIPAARPEMSLPEKFRKQTVAFKSTLPPGSIVVRPDERFLYVVHSRTKAIRYGIGVPKSHAGWSGKLSVGRKAKWPSWRPSKRMIRLNPEYVAFKDGIAGGIDNPLGARALYLYRNGVDTLYRIHGTNEPWTIGEAVSSGCIRMLNRDVEDLYRRVQIGATVLVE